jgi:hypothetical protein
MCGWCGIYVTVGYLDTAGLCARRMAAMSRLHVCQATRHDEMPLLPRSCGKPDAPRQGQGD